MINTMENEIIEMPIIRVSPEVSWHIKSNFGVVSCESGNKYFHDPHWHKLNIDGSFTAYSYENLPKELTDLLNGQRHTVVKYNAEYTLSTDETFKPDNV
ncbi:MAG: hypothetical protein JWQ09_939 [Segetibacter sp.]|nr:hypothetical protein [Segetibacter sp.]